MPADKYYLQVFSMSFIDVKYIVSAYFDADLLAKGPNTTDIAGRLPPHSFFRKKGGFFAVPVLHRGKFYTLRIVDAGQWVASLNRHIFQQHKAGQAILHSFLFQVGEEPAFSTPEIPVNSSMPDMNLSTILTIPMYDRLTKCVADVCQQQLLFFAFRLAFQYHERREVSKSRDQSEKDATLLSPFPGLDASNKAQTCAGENGVRFDQKSILEAFASAGSLDNAPACAKQGTRGVNPELVVKPKDKVIIDLSHSSDSDSDKNLARNLKRRRVVESPDQEGGAVGGVAVAAKEDETVPSNNGWQGDDSVEEDGAGDDSVEGAELMLDEGEEEWSEQFWLPHEERWMRLKRVLIE